MRNIFILFLFTVAIFLEIAFFSRVSILGVAPDILLMFLVASFFVVSEFQVFTLSLVGCLIIGLYSPIVWGGHFLIILIVLLVLYILHHYIFTNVNMAVLFVLAIISTVIYDLGLVALYSIWGQRISFSLFFSYTFFLKLFLNSIITLVWFFPLKTIWESSLRRESFSKLLR